MTAAPEYRTAPAAGASPTSAQLALWMEEQTGQGPSNSGYLAVTLLGEVGVEDVRAAALDVVRRHEPLRTVFRLTAEGELRLFVLPADEVFVFGVVREDCLAGAEPEAVLQWVSLHERPRHWDLAVEGPIRFALLRHGRARCSVVFSVHHSGFDGRSKFVVAEDFTRHLKRIRAGATEPVLPLAGAVPREADGATTAAAVRHWTRALPDLAQPLVLPSTTSRAGRRVVSSPPRTLAPRDVSRLHELAHRHGVTTFTALVAALGLQLAAYGNRVVPLGVAADISDPDTSGIAGVQINVVPALLTVDPDAAGTELLAAAGAAVADLRRFRRVPFADLTRALPGTGTGQVLTQLGLSFPRAPKDLDLAVPGLDPRWQFFTENTAGTFGRTLQVRALWPHCEIRLDHQGAATGSRGAELFLDHFQQAVARLSATPRAKVSAFGLPPATTRRTRAPLRACERVDLAAMLRLRTVLAPDTPALVHGRETLTNADLAWRLLRPDAAGGSATRALTAPLAELIATDPERTRSLWSSALCLTTALTSGEATRWIGDPGFEALIEAVAAWQREAVFLLGEGPAGPGREPAVRLCGPGAAAHAAVHWAGADGAAPARPDCCTPREVVVPFDQLRHGVAPPVWHRTPGNTLGSYYRAADGQPLAWVLLPAQPVHPPRLTALPGVRLCVLDAGGRELPTSVPGLLAHRAGAKSPPTLTGDLGRVTSDGVVEHLGRAGRRWIRHQGFIDVPLVERALSAHPSVLEARLELRDSPRGPSAVATVRLRERSGRTDAGELRARLRRSIPGQGLPGRIDITTEPLPPGAG
ncbi:condensation domain-containing protein [Streptomyces sp. NBC_00096]|uniref:condensation domain-containing protein n=1 Tax=Streptomyces sp. NBC_00096 TaxID=2975650 RepID=UPI003244345D